MQQLLKKLQLKDHYQGKILNLPDSLAKDFTKWPSGMISTKRKELDYILVFARNAADIKKHSAAAIRQLRQDGLALIGFPKLSSGLKTDINRDAGWEPLDALGYKPVRLISLDEIWSVFRFREKSLVK